MSKHPIKEGKMVARNGIFKSKKTRNNIRFSSGYHYSRIYRLMYFNHQVVHLIYSQAFFMIKPKRQQWDDAQTVLLYYSPGNSDLSTVPK